MYSTLGFPLKSLSYGYLILKIHFYPYKKKKKSRNRILRDE